MPVGSEARADIIMVLSPMVLRRAIIRYETNFHEMRSHGAPPAVKVWILQRDELSIARVRRKILGALPAYLKGLQLQILSDLPAEMR